VGRKRKRNEDSLFVDDRLGLYVVADGMGGYAGGDVASTIAVNAVSTSFDVSGGFVAKTGVVDDARPRGGNELVWSIEQANRAIVERAAEDESYTGMGTTIVAARFSRRRQRVFIAHVGDSRCYRIRGEKMTLLTRDHTLAGKGMTGPLAAHLSRALGASNDVKVDLLVDAPLRGDRYLLCSDGLSKMIDEETIASLALAHANDSVDAVVQALVDKANAAGGRDNITVIFVLIEEPQDPAKADRGAGRSAPDAPRKTDGDGTER
jgi:protein phosphatase